MKLSFNYHYCISILNAVTLTCTIDAENWVFLCFVNSVTFMAKQTVGITMQNTNAVAAATAATRPLSFLILLID